MEIEIQIDKTRTEPKLLILTDHITDEITDLMNRLSSETPQMIAGFANDTAVVLDASKLVRLYAADNKVFATTHEGEYRVRLRLYELEERLDRKTFVRISNSEIINLQAVKSFDLSLAGTICVSLTNGDVTYVSRRYVSKIKQALGL